MSDVISSPPAITSGKNSCAVPTGEADPICEKSLGGQTGPNQRKIEFKDLIDVINPLQHLPLVSNMYRSISGDEIGVIPKFLGGAVFGGPVGLVMALGSYIAESNFVSTEHEQPRPVSHNKNNEEPQKQNLTFIPRNSSNKTEKAAPTNNMGQFFEGLRPRKSFSFPEPTKTKIYKLEPLHETPTSDKTRAPNKTDGLDKEIPKKANRRFPPAISGPSENAITVPNRNSQIQHWMLQTLSKYEKLSLR